MRHLSMIFMVGFFLINFQGKTQQWIQNNKDLFEVPDKEGFKEAWNYIEKGDKRFKENDPIGYRDALENYLFAFKYNSNDAALNYKIGVCYMLSSPKTEALGFIKHAFELDPEVSSDIQKVLGRTYQYNYEFDIAIKYYETYIAAETDTNKTAIARKYVQECRTGMEQLKKPRKVFIDNMGKYVNSAYNEYTPVLQADGSRMYFTSRRAGTTGDIVDPITNQYVEDVYFSYKMDKLWGLAVNVGKPINTDVNDAIIGLSPDGKKIFIYRDKGEGNLYECDLKDNYWDSPKPLSKVINSPYHESSISLTYDGRTMYFTSENPENNLGSSDIFISELNDKGEWGKPQNLGPEINTPYREESVFLLPDGKTLYFSSEGHNSIGGLDIFVTKRKDDGTWSKPENLGIPINTPEDDFSITVTPDQKFAYYSSDRKDSYGGNDIYKITFLDDKLDLLSSEDNLILSLKKTIKEEPSFTKAPVFNKEDKVTLIKGQIKDKETGKPVFGKVTVVDNDKNEDIIKTTAGESTGDYVATLPAGKDYAVIFEGKGYLFTSENIIVPANQAFKEINKTIELSPLKVNSKTILRNIFFEPNKDVLNVKSLAELNRLVEFLSTNANTKIEVAYYSKTKQLAGERAKSIASFLAKRGIKPERVITTGISLDDDKNKAIIQDSGLERMEIKILGI